MSNETYKENNSKGYKNKQSQFIDIEKVKQFHNEFNDVVNKCKNNEDKTDLVYVWCVKKTFPNNKTLFYPITSTLGQLDVESLSDFNSYKILAANNKKDVMNYSSIVNTVQSSNNKDIELIQITMNEFESLENQFKELINDIIKEVLKCFVLLDDITIQTGVSTNSLKIQILISIFDKFESLCY